MADTNTIRLYCTLAGLEENWVEVDAFWTLGDFLKLSQPGLTNQNVIEILQDKGKACHIGCLDDTVIERTADLTLEQMTEHDLDMRLFGFVMGAPLEACTQLRSLGNASARRSLNGFAGMMSAPISNPPTSTTARKP